MQYVIATAFGLVLLVLVANLLVDLYARGAVREALDEATRAGTRVDASVGTCVERAEEALDAALRGSMGDRVSVRCIEGPEWVSATADVVLVSWVPWMLPDWHLTLSATSVRER